MTTYIIATKMEQRYVIKYYVVQNLSPAETKTKMKAVNGGNCYSNCQIKCWQTEFCDGHLLQSSSTLRMAVNLMHTARHQHWECDYMGRLALITLEIGKAGEYSK